MPDTVVVVQSVADTVTIIETDTVESLVPVAEVIESEGGVVGVIYGPAEAVTETVITEEPEVIIETRDSA